MGGKHSATSHGQVIQDEKNNVLQLRVICWIPVSARFMTELTTL